MPESKFSSSECKENFIFSAESRENSPLRSNFRAAKLKKSSFFFDESTKFAKGQFSCTFSLSFQKYSVSLPTKNKMLMTNDEELLVKILKLSHEKVMAGKSFSQDEAERFLDQRLYEFRDKVVGTCVAEPC